MRPRKSSATEEENWHSSKVGKHHKGSFPPFSASDTAIEPCILIACQEEILKYLLTLRKFDLPAVHRLRAFI
jgi:hypothetical protein